MASIEVSLSTTPRRKNGKKSVNGSITGKPSTPKTGTLVDSCKELEMLRRALRDKENTIQTLQGQAVSPPRPLDASERRAAEVRLQTLGLEEDMRRGNIARVSEALQKIDSDENNIDVRIRQAELEYELGREELALLGVREEKRSLQISLEAKPPPTLFSCLQPPGRLVLQAVTVECDPKSPKFGAGNSDDHPGLVVQWATEESGLKKGDRIVEVNGKLTLSTSREELSRLLAVCPARGELVVCRVWTPPPSPDESLRRENLRLTHRISYLEDQVAELLSFKEKTLTPQLEVFQKGSQVTVLSSPETTRTKRQQYSDAPSDSDGSLWRRNNHSDTAVGPSQQYHDVDSYKPSSYGDKVRVLNRRYDKEETSQSLPRGNRPGDSGISTVYIHSTKTAQSVHSLSDMERTSRRRQQPVDYSSETTCPRYRSHRDRSVKSLDLDADTSGQDTLTRHPKPEPPKKPLRLSIQRATSLQSMQFAGPGSTSRKLRQKGVAPQPPDGHSVNDVPHHAFRWPANFHRNKGRAVHVGEKWC